VNWLAHLFLSENDVEMRLGNILADIVKGKARQQLNSEIQRGIECHQIIDRFTDNHPIFKHSQQRFDSQYRRFSGVLVDIFYDHFLAKNWTDYTDMTLDEFTTEIYTSFQAYPGDIPCMVRQFIGRIAAEDWLGSYRDIDGVEKSLLRISNRLSRRFKKPFMLNQAVEELTNNYDELEQDFQNFFPELNLYVKNSCFGKY
jgi:acyl carrier protein phosphodiesterase